MTKMITLKSAIELMKNDYNLTFDTVSRKWFIMKEECFSIKETNALKIINESFKTHLVKDESNNGQIVYKYKE